ncbi:unnamed protein product [Paramecium pentaurelia]|uniref:Transmembrane protein n=1 Tax=Paramecium pentaurelia TaxID=43138 RepID=A0A8S1Y7B6_9CILI|nr:unnamed protein product [Paramecium pentaurelia]
MRSYFNVYANLWQSIIFFFQLIDIHSLLYMVTRIRIMQDLLKLMMKRQIEKQQEFKYSQNYLLIINYYFCLYLQYLIQIFFVSLITQFL